MHPHRTGLRLFMTPRCQKAAGHRHVAPVGDGQRGEQEGLRGGEPVQPVAHEIVLMHDLVADQFEAIPGGGTVTVGFGFRTHVAIDSPFPPEVNAHTAWCQLAHRFAQCRYPNADTGKPQAN